ncbi:MAG: hypothetical protein Q8L34_05515 [Candidatus Woesearchaeota archaeon]|nr:hypothetical protein [Candidatus Woesearchaeota archaeon]
MEMTQTTDTLNQAIKYQGQEIGRVVQGRIVPTISDIHLIDLIEDMEPEERTHLPSTHPGIQLLVDHYNIPKKAYLAAEDIPLTAASEGLHSRDSVAKHDPGLLTLMRDLHATNQMRPVFH